MVFGQLLTYVVVSSKGLCSSSLLRSWTLVTFWAWTLLVLTWNPPEGPCQRRMVFQDPSVRFHDGWREGKCKVWLLFVGLATQPVVGMDQFHFFAMPPEHPRCNPSKSCSHKKWSSSLCEGSEFGTQETKEEPQAYGCGSQNRYQNGLPW